MSGTANQKHQAIVDANRARLSAIWLIFAREMRDQLRDRRTLFTIAVLPILNVLVTFWIGDVCVLVLYLRGPSNGPCISKQLAFVPHSVGQEILLMFTPNMLCGFPGVMPSHERSLHAVGAHVHSFSLLLYV